MGKKIQNRKGKRRGKKGVISFIHFFVRLEDSPLTLNHLFNVIDPSPSPCLPLSDQPYGFFHLTISTKLLRGLPGTFELAHYMDFVNLPPILSSQFISTISSLEPGFSNHLSTVDPLHSDSQDLLARRH